MFKLFGNLLFQNHSCIVCGIEIEDGTKFSICKDCLKNIEKIDNNKYLKYQNFNRKYKINISYCYYNETASLLIKKFKYSGKKFYSEYIAEMMTENIHLLGNIDYLTFVPVSKSGISKRGYNQSEELAREISKLTGIPVLDLLGKKDGYVNQAGLTQKQRRDNLKDAFFVKDNNNVSIENKKILLIDDLFTTGTTLKRCSEVLMKLRPKLIDTMTFAKTKFEKIEKTTKNNK